MHQDHPLDRSARRRGFRSAAAATAAALILAACAGPQPAGGGAGLAPDDGTDACRPQVTELDRSGAYFAAPIIAGAAVIGAGGILGTRPGIIGGIVWAASSAAAAVAATSYLEQRRREAADEAALATAVGNDIERENAAIEQTQQAMDRVLECRLQQARRVQEQERAGALQRQQAAAQMAALRAQAERDLQRSRQIAQRVEARAAEIEPALDTIAPGPRTPPPRPAVAVRPARPVPLQAAPVAAAAPAPAAQVQPRQDVRVRPARNPDFVAVETPAGERLGYAPVAVFSIPPAQMRAISVPAAAPAADAAPSGRVRTLAGTNIARRDNFREAVQDLERAVSGSGFEVGT